MTATLGVCTQGEGAGVVDVRDVCMGAVGMGEGSMDHARARMDTHGT
jgi:hypothetical protein